MASPADQPLIAALDIGSSKVGALICTMTDDGRLQVLGTGQREGRGVKRGFITDMEASEHAVREAVELAERMSGVTIEDVWASFGAASISTLPTLSLPSNSSASFSTMGASTLQGPHQVAWKSTSTGPPACWSTSDSKLVSSKV